jgi:hypothetical protein
MERMFERWGKVVDVYIAKKRNKTGRFFGFVNEKWLEDQLRDVWFGSYKAWVNISRYAKPYRKENKTRQNRGEQRQVNNPRMKTRNNNHTKTEKDLQKRQSFRREGETYVEAMRNGEATTSQNKEAMQGGRQRTKKEDKVSQAEGERESTGLAITINGEEMAWAKNGYVGLVRNIEEVQMIQTKLEEEGITTVKAIPMGGERIFLKAVENEDFRSLVKESEQIFQQMFSLIREWKPRDT